MSASVPANGMTARGHRALLKTIALYERRPDAHDFYSWFHLQFNARTDCACPLAWIGHYARLKGGDYERMEGAARLIGFATVLDFYDAGEAPGGPGTRWAIADYSKALRLLKRIARRKVKA